MADSRMDLILKKLNGEDVELVPPMSRIEKIYFKLLGYDIELDPPQSRSEVLLTEYVNNGGGGDITVEPLSVTENNTYTAPTGKAYSPVTVNVPGGGGSSTYTITLISAPIPEYPDAPASVNYNINCFDENYVYLCGAVKTDEGYLGEYQTEVWASASQDVEFMLFSSKGIRVTDNNARQPLSVTGDAEIVHYVDEEDDSYSYWYVYVTGNCTITYQGSR